MLNEMFYMFLFMLGLKKHFGHISLGTSHISGAQQPHVATDRIAGSRQGSRESRGPRSSVSSSQPGPQWEHGEVRGSQLLPSLRLAGPPLSSCEARGQESLPLWGALR